MSTVSKHLFSYITYIILAVFEDSMRHLHEAYLCGAMHKFDCVVYFGDIYEVVDKIIDS